MLLFGLGIGALLIVVGMITYVFAPLVGPNPIFGIRVGYAFASREIWDRTNRLGGGMIAILGIIVTVSGLVLMRVGVPDAEAMLGLTALMLLGSIGSTVWLFFYARGLANAAPIARNLAPIPFRWSYVAPVVVSYLLLVALALYFYPSLPVQRMATHFDIRYRPNGYMPRDTFMITFLGLAALFVLIDLAVVLVATREPMISFERWGNGWQMGPERGLVFMGIVFSFTILLLGIVFCDTAAFNIGGAHIFPLALLFPIILGFILVIAALFFILGRRVPPDAF